MIQTRRKKHTETAGVKRHVVQTKTDIPRNMRPDVEYDPDQ